MFNQISIFVGKIKHYRRMNKLFLSISVILLPYILLSAQTETYFVTHIKGKIINKTTNKSLKLGDKLKATDKILYNPNNAAAILMSNQKGRFVLGKPADAKPTPTGDFLAFVKSTVVPVKSNGYLSSRGTVDDLITDLKGTIGNENFVFPGNLGKLVLSDKIYPMNANKFFIFRYMYESKAVNKKISFIKDTLAIDKKSLFVVNGQPVNPEQIENAGVIDLYYYDQATKASMKVTSFKPVFTDEEILKEEFKNLIKIYKTQKMTDEVILENLTEHLQTVYNGKSDKHMVAQWMKEKIKL